MKLGAWSVKLITLMTAFLLCTRAVKNGYHSMHAQQKVVVHIDAGLSDPVQQAITQFVQEKNKDSSPKFYEMSQLLVKTFPCIESVNIERTAAGLVYYSIYSAKPIIGINQDWALTDHGQLLFKSCFADHFLNSLHTLQVPSGSVSDALRALAPSLSDDLLTAYDVCWVSDQEIYVKDKTQSHFSLLCNAQTLPDAKHLERCQTIKAELTNNGSFELKKVKNTSSEWVADMRFKNQIIVYFELGSPFSQDGANHGGQRYG
ncbi:MAG: hypothetical protein P4L31_00780 [Candidatus Babeliales bacterium]|nr:hypothetical protein [Candidatus Babeliales bacterium]